jgi:hypothetical protein
MCPEAIPHSCLNKTKTQMLNWAPITSVLIALLFGWFLSFVGLDNIVVRAINENFPNRKPVTKATYYTIFLLAGVVYGAVFSSTYAISRTIEDSTTRQSTNTTTTPTQLASSAAKAVTPAALRFHFIK